MGRADGRLLQAAEFSPRRFYTMLGLAGLAAAVALLMGSPGAALGVLAGTPVGMLNYWLSLSAVKKSREASGAAAQGLILGRTLLRMFLAVAALLIAARFGPEFLLGVLAGLILEMLTYFGDVAGLMLRRKG